MVVERGERIAALEIRKDLLRRNFCVMNRCYSWRCLEEAIEWMNEWWKEGEN